MEAGIIWASVYFVICKLNKNQFICSEQKLSGRLVGLCIPALGWAAQLVLTYCQTGLAIGYDPILSFQNFCPPVKNIVFWFYFGQEDPSVKETGPGHSRTYPTRKFKSGIHCQKKCGVWKLKKMSLRRARWNLTRVTHGDGVGGTPHPPLLKFPHIWKLHEQLNLSAEQPRKQFGNETRAKTGLRSSDGQNRKTKATSAAHKSDPIPQRQEVETGKAASDEKRISWNNLDLSKGRKTTSPNVTFQEFSSYGAASFGQPGVPENSSFWTRIVLWTNSPCNRPMLLCGGLETVVWCLYALKGLIVTTGLFSCCHTYDTFWNAEDMEIVQTRNTAAGNHNFSDMKKFLIQYWRLNMLSLWVGTCKIVCVQVKTGK